MEQSILIKISPEELKKIITDSIQEALQPFLNSKLSLFGEFPEPMSVNLDTICKMYGWKKPTVYGWVHDRSIPHSKAGKLLYFNIADIEEWIAKGRRKTICEIEAEVTGYLVRPRSKSLIS